MSESTILKRLSHTKMESATFHLHGLHLVDIGCSDARLFIGKLNKKKRTSCFIGGKNISLSWPTSWVLKKAEENFQTMAPLQTITLWLIAISVASSLPINSITWSPRAARGRSLPLISNSYSIVERYSETAASRSKKIELETGAGSTGYAAGATEPAAPEANVTATLQQHDSKDDDNQGQVEQVNAASPKSGEQLTEGVIIQQVPEETVVPEERSSVEMTIHADDVDGPQPTSQSDEQNLPIELEKIEQEADAQPVPVPENKQDKDETVDPEKLPEQVESAKESTAIGEATEGTEEETKVEAKELSDPDNEPMVEDSKSENQESGSAQPVVESDKAEVDKGDSVVTDSDSDVIEIEPKIEEAAQVEPAKVDDEPEVVDNQAEVNNNEPVEVKVAEESARENHNADSGAVQVEDTPTTSTIRSEELFVENRAFKLSPDDLNLAEILGHTTFLEDLPESRYELDALNNEDSTNGVRFERDEKKPEDKKEKMKEKEKLKEKLNNNKPSKKIIPQISDEPVHEYDNPTREGREQSTEQPEEAVTLRLLPPNYPVVLPNGKAVLSDQIDLVRSLTD